MFVYGIDIPLENIPCIASEASISTSGGKEGIPHLFTYGMDIPLEGFYDNE